MHTLDCNTIAVLGTSSVIIDTSFSNTERILDRFPTGYSRPAGADHRP